MDPLALAQQLGGAASWTELRRHGVPRRAVDAAVRRGDLLVCGRGGVCLPQAEKLPATVAVRLGAVLSCGSAAVHHGLEVFGEPELHLARATPGRGGSGLVVHRRRVSADSRSTDLRQTLGDCARCLPVPQAVSVLDSAVRQGRVDADELASLVPRGGRWVVKVTQVVALVDPAAQSVLESGMRVLLAEAGVGPVASQVYVASVGWVDFLVRGWLVIEVDGFSVHRGTFREDRRRDAELARLGLVVLRFTYRDVLHRPGWVVQVVLDTLRAGRPPFTRGAQRQARER